jgi:hypothetical protein
MASRKLLSRGVASVEAVLVLPLFVIFFVSLFYVRDLVVARQSAEAKTRTCVWLYSNENCDRVPPGCEQTLLALRAAAEKVDGRIESALSGASIWPISIIVSNILEPVLRAAFGKAVAANTPLTYQRPPLYGGDTGVATGSYYLACNITPKTERDIVKEAWDDILDALWPG